MPTSALTVAQHTMSANWCAGWTSYNGDFATPGAANPPCVVAPGLGDIVITEIMANPVAVMDEVGEWLEIQNTRRVMMDLTGCRLRDDGMDDYALPGTIMLPPSSIATFACGASPGFEPTYVYARTELQLANSADEVVLVCGTTEIDRVNYPMTRVPLGASSSLDPASTDAEDNDADSAWCAGATAYNVDLGTPGTANDECP